MGKEKIAPNLGRQIDKQLGYKHLKKGKNRLRTPLMDWSFVKTQFLMVSPIAISSLAVGTSFSSH